MDFGFTLKPEHSIERTLALARQAEAAGFTHGWLFDSHVLWRDPYPLLTLIAQATTTLRLGTCVTNPATREPSVTASTLAVLQDLPGGWDVSMGNVMLTEQGPVCITDGPMELSGPGQFVCAVCGAGALYAG